MELRELETRANGPDLQDDSTRSEISGTEVLSSAQWSAPAAPRRHERQFAAGFAADNAASATIIYRKRQLRPPRRR